MIDTKNCAKNEVKDTERQYGLPETNEMEAERYATEDRGASYSLEFRGTGICFFNKNTLAPLATKIFINLVLFLLRQLMSM